MSLPTETSLSARRCLLQQQLRAQRQEIIAQLNPRGETEPHFPRSMTMRFLSGHIGLKILTGLAVRRLVMHYPRVLANIFTLTRLFKSKHE